MTPCRIKWKMQQRQLTQYSRFAFCDLPALVSTTCVECRRYNRTINQKPYHCKCLRSPLQE
eukprot:736582-Amphidinium_carterae.1